MSRSGGGGEDGIVISQVRFAKARRRDERRGEGAKGQAVQRRAAVLPCGTDRDRPRGGTGRRSRRRWRRHFGRAAFVAKPTPGGRGGGAAGSWTPRIRTRYATSRLSSRSSASIFPFGGAAGTALSASRRASRMLRAPGGPRGCATQSAEQANCACAPPPTGGRGGEEGPNSLRESKSLDPKAGCNMLCTSLQNNTFELK